MDPRRLPSAGTMVLAMAIASCRGAAPAGPSLADASAPAPTPSSPLASSGPLRARDLPPLVSALDLGRELDPRPEEDPLRSRTLRLGFDRVLCSLDASSAGGGRDVARCQPRGRSLGTLVAADDEAPISVQSDDGVYDVATADRVLPIDPSPPRSHADAYRLRDGAVLALERSREHGDSGVQLVRRDASGTVARSAVAQSAGEIETGRIVGDWVLVSERASYREHRLVARRIVDGGRSLGPGLPFGVLRTDHRADVSIQGTACRSPGGVFVMVYAQSIDFEPGNEYALAMLTGDRWTHVPISDPGALGCHGAEATFTKQRHGSVVQVRCAAGGCRELVADAPHEARATGPGDVAAVADEILFVWGSGPVFMALSPLPELATARATPIYQPEDGEVVKAIDVYVRQTAAVALVRTSRGALAIRIDGPASFSPVRPLLP